MLAIHETPTKIIGLSFGDFSGLEIFCDIASKDGQREQMVNRIIVGKTDMTNSEVFGIKAKRARYYVLFCFRLVVLDLVDNGASLLDNLRNK